MQRIETQDARFVDLIRHGMPVGGQRYRGHRDDPLSEQGWRQMWAAVGDAAPWDLVVTSPLTRCRAFAESLAARHAIRLVVEPRFAEISFGEWEGRTVTEILAQSPEQLSGYWADPVAGTPPGGESLEAFRGRLLAGWEALLARDCRRALLVGHGGLIRVLTAALLDMPLAAALRLEVPNAALTRFRVQSDINGRVSPSLVYHARERL
ncbi:histidine phosphatase family protein [Arhodomonas sp. SL1]|uniref:histidine phosphatase family protein n=1 Tax=Arhodomonas sp. SL1 TaxID=3425691 RepID=UPI003F881E9B